MKANNTIIKSYKNKGAYVTIRGIIPNLQTMTQVPFSFECRIDTGFDGGIFAPIWYKSDAEVIGVKPRITNITLADGSKTPAYVCAAYIQEIDQCHFPPPGKSVIFVMCGGRRGQLLGMDALKYCTTLFDGPNQSLTIKF